ncbi:MAG: NAD(P)H-dependent oxidoreductase subunit E [Fimbriimonas sp.]|nr:NAD(P)H-dependent oxidoreductase subunit E [Fimbriimonas sp.]
MSTVAANPYESAVTRLIEEHGSRPENLIPILQSVQEEFRFLPDPVLRMIAERTGIAASEIEGVAGFYSYFRRTPVGENMVRVCHGTACHVRGADLVEDSLRRHLAMSSEDETDTSGRFTLERVACVGCCSLAPVVVVNGVTFGGLNAETAPRSLIPPIKRVDSNTRVQAATRQGPIKLRIATDSCCAACGSVEVRRSLEEAAQRYGLLGAVETVSCTGICHQMPMCEVVDPAGGSVRYTQIKAEEADAIVRRHLRSGIGGRLKSGISGLLDWFVDPNGNEGLESRVDPRDPMLCEFLHPQLRIAMEGNGVTAPLDLDAYRAQGGFQALEAVRASGDPNAVIDAVFKSGIRGRGGAGFPTGRKWRMVRDAKGLPKTLICNGDEGDPGAFMDRMLLESFPFRVLEGMLIAAYAMGIEVGILYIRAEYPHAVASIRKAIEIVKSEGLLGSMRLRIARGAGAFVCGEETALINSLEGHRGIPRVRPPYPAEAGLWGKPTCVNNVETFALIPWIVRNGADAFAAIGSKGSKGTKVFALAGAVRRGGLIEVPMGTTIRQIVEEIGGGVGEGRTFKAVLVGGPSGGCVPASMADTPVDYEALQSAGAIMGSGGMVVLDDRSCMVDLARFFIRFTQNESCGKCTMCRVGTRRMLEILDRICEGHGTADDLDRLETLAEAITQGSLCGLGQTAPNPVLSTLRHFRSEYEAHLEGRCPAGRCMKLIRYRVNDRCIGCTRCAQVCPVDAIEMRPHERHVIDDVKCVRCDVCRVDCPEEAIVVE